MKILVMAGGTSCERAVSLQSGECVARALHRCGHTVACCDSGAPAFAQDLTFYTPQQALPSALFAAHATADSFDSDLLPHLRKADVVFLALHGGTGEDGTMQSLLELYGIPYTGASPLPCRLAMDKSVAKELWTAAKIPTPCAVVLQGATKAPPPSLCYPCVLKPIDGGSSIGVKMVQNRTQCEAYLQKREENTPLLAETYIKGSEFSVGILDGCALPPVEILAEGYYDYDQKYCENGAQEICPAPLSQAESEELQRLALDAARVLRMDGACRIDFLQKEQNGQFYCLEANALPGMTARSLLPLCAQAAGISFSQLCEKIAEDGAKHPRTRRKV